MKFGKVLEEEVVAEWRLKYLDYRLAKKKLKAVSRAIRSANRTPSTLKGSTPSNPTPVLRAPVFNFLNSNQHHDSSDDEDDLPPDSAPAERASSRAGAGPVTIPQSGTNEHSPLRQPAGGNRRDSRGMTRYGSIIGTPPENDNALARAPSLQLPGPAISSAQPPHNAVASGDSRPNTADGPPQSRPTDARVTSQDSLQPPKTRRPTHFPRLSNALKPQRSNSMPVGVAQDGGNGKQSLASRMLTFRPRRKVTFSTPEEMPMEVYKDIEDRQHDFFAFLDQEMDKIDGFYREKEQEATKRLQALRDQLHVMRDRRMVEIMRAAEHAGTEPAENGTANGDAQDGDRKASKTKDFEPAWLRPFDKAVDKAKIGHVGKTFQAMKDLGTPSGPSAIDLYRDYTKKQAPLHVPYRSAKHKLKVALAEYYRGLELLKSYALLNRTAFRKITKKYDKTVRSNPGSRYMSDKVSKAYFVKSEVVEGHIHAVEDLYARYFERGNHKIAVSKLRAKIAKAGEFSASAFQNGVLLALGTAFGIEGLVYGANHLYSKDALIRVHTQSLLQLYAGFFLAILLALFFCLACRFWHRSKVNYTFIFEFDTRRQVLDWRQLSQIPCVLYFLLGLFVWLNFRMVGGAKMYLYWPVVLAGLVVIVLFLPLPVFYPKSRKWFAYSSWRLLFAGIYPVEFRDFFLGDLFCSQTYAIGNLALFSCLYAQRPPWYNPSLCGSGRSRALGFLTCLPGIWRALQCLRRYKDTRNSFPHLVNCGKYLCTILYYMSLSLYRINHATPIKALFIAFATINAFYCSIWDLVMDWSLMDPYAKHRFLRQNLAFKSTWLYYSAMVIDPIIRFNWIFYAIYTEDLQHASIVAFFVAFSEVCRRGMWMVFRVENEHCANVGRFRAYRDAPLPYSITDAASMNKLGSSEQVSPETASPQQAAANLEAGFASPTHGSGSSESPLSPAAAAASVGSSGFKKQVADAANQATELRRRRGQPVSDSPVARALARAGTMMHLAHTQDFERKRRPDGSGSGSHGDGAGIGGHGPSGGGDDDDDDDDSDNTETDLE